MPSSRRFRLSDVLHCNRRCVLPRNSLIREHKFYVETGFVFVDRFLQMMQVYRSHPTSPESVPSRVIGRCMATFNCEVPVINVSAAHQLLPHEDLELISARYSADIRPQLPRGSGYLASHRHDQVPTPAIATLSKTGSSQCAIIGVVQERPRQGHRLP